MCQQAVNKKTFESSRAGPCSARAGQYIRRGKIAAMAVAVMTNVSTDGSDTICTVKAGPRIVFWGMPVRVGTHHPTRDSFQI